MAGGFEDGVGEVGSVEEYNPTNQMWTTIGSLNYARHVHTTTLLPNGQVIVAGGGNSSGALAITEVYYYAIGTWTNTGSLNTARFSHTATLLPDGKVLVAGGATNGPLSISSAELV